VDLLPGHRVVADVLAEPAILTACAWHDGEKSAQPRGNVAHVLARAELAVGHVEEIRVADDLAQEVQVS